MGEFLSTLAVTPVDGTDGGRSKWQLLQPLAYASKYLKDPIVVPEGFITDFASVPRVPLLYLMMNDVGQPAAVIHDFLYGEGKIERKIADKVLDEALASVGVSWWKRQAMYTAVRLAGGFSFKGK